MIDGEYGIEDYTFLWQGEWIDIRLKSLGFTIPKEGERITSRIVQRIAASKAFIKDINLNLDKKVAMYADLRDALECRFDDSDNKWTVLLDSTSGVTEHGY